MLAQKDQHLQISVLLVCCCGIPQSGLLSFFSILVWLDLKIIEIGTNSFRTYLEREGMI